MHLHLLCTHEPPSALLARPDLGPKWHKHLPDFLAVRPVENASLLRFLINVCVCRPNFQLALAKGEIVGLNGLALYLNGLRGLNGQSRANI